MAAQQSNDQPFTGAHPTNREFVEQLRTWGFTPRKEDGVHLVFRGPHGGTLRVIRSLLGRADSDRVEKAARLAGITAERFWAGPEVAVTEPQRSKAAAPRRRRQRARDQVTSLVLSIHAGVDRPLGFDQVVEQAGGRVTRDQVRTASAQLCREGDLDRIRTGVYQWSGGARALSRAAVPAQARGPLTDQSQIQPEVSSRPAPAAVEAARTSASQLFEQLFPSGVRMTAELLADFERWAELTEKLAEHARAS